MMSNPRPLNNHLINITAMTTISNSIIISVSTDMSTTGIRMVIKTTQGYYTTNYFTISCDGDITGSFTKI